MNRIELPDDGWQRVSPKQIPVELVGSAISLLVLCFIGASPLLFGAPWGWVTLAIAVIISVLTLAFIPRRVRSIGYLLRDDDLLYRRGIMFQRFVSVPYGRMQLIDISRGPIARWLGISSLKFVTAAAASNVTIDGLPDDVVEPLRDQLVALAEARRAGL